MATIITEMLLFRIRYVLTKRQQCYRGGVCEGGGVVVEGARTFAFTFRRFFVAVSLFLSCCFVVLRFCFAFVLLSFVFFHLQIDFCFSLVVVVVNLLFLLSL